MATRIFSLSFLVFFSLAASCWLPGCAPRDRCTITCQNGGVCEGNHCICPNGYEGERCGTLSREKFLGNYTVRQGGSATSPALYTASVEPGTEVTDVVIKNLHNTFTLVKGYLRSDTLWIPPQEQAGRQVEGKGLPGSSGGKTLLKMYYKITDLASSDVEDYGYDYAGNAVFWEK